MPAWENQAESSEPGEKEVVVLLHGLARSNTAMWLLKQRLEEAGFHVEAIDYASFNQTSQQII
ncbi:MAG: alpha/beta hydrolase, partial [Candidatus Thiodiazotropha weberae]|nr:alpha/beta hydrolase [Candidatus Thiodiazotropha weberae]